MEETGAPSIRAKQMRSRWESAMATAAAFCICEAFSTIRSTIRLASEYSMVWRVLMYGRIHRLFQYQADARKAELGRKEFGRESKLSRPQSVCCSLENKLQSKLHNTEGVIRSEEHTSELQSPCNLV